jgi:hypothetical protein
MHPWTRRAVQDLAGILPYVSHLGIEQDHHVGVIQASAENCAPAVARRKEIDISAFSICLRLRRDNTRIAIDGVVIVPLPSLNAYENSNALFYAFLRFLFHQDCLRDGLCGNVKANSEQWTGMSAITSVIVTLLLGNSYDR